MEIHINERTDPFAIASKYAIKYIGINIRPVSYEDDEENRRYIVHCNAIIPNVCKECGHPKEATIIEDVATIIVNYSNKVVEATPNEKIDDKINDFLSKQ